MSIKSLALVVLGLLFLYGLFTVGFPFLLALVVAIFLEPANELLMKRAKLNRIAAATINSTLFLLGLLGLMILIGLKVFTELGILLQRADEYFLKVAKFFQMHVAENLQNWIEQYSLEYGDQVQEFVRSGTGSISNALVSFGKFVSSQFLYIVSGIPNFFIFFIVFSVAIYLFSYSLPMLKSSFLSLFEPNSREKVDTVLQNLRRSIFGFMRAQLILSTLTYILSAVGLLILGAKYALAVALLIVIVDILPVLGTGSFLVPWAIINFLVGDYSFAFGLLALFLFITIIRRIVEPKVLGDAVGIGALPALISLYVGFKLVGVIGFFLGPIVVIIYQAMRKVGLLKISIKLD